MLYFSSGLKEHSLYIESGTTASSSDIQAKKEEGIMWVPQTVDYIEIDMFSKLTSPLQEILWLLYKVKIVPLILLWYQIHIREQVVCYMTGFVEMHCWQWEVSFQKLYRVFWDCLKKVSSRLYSVCDNSLSWLL